MPGQPEHVGDENGQEFIATGSLDLVQDTEAEAQVEDHEALMNDPSVVTVSFRRHGAYERGDTEGKEQLKGQLTSETFGGVREAAKDWVNSLPDDVDIQIIASPTFMPAERPVSEEVQERHPGATTRIEPRRASVTSALYADELRNRYGKEFGGYLASEDMSELGQTVRAAADLPEPENARRLDQRLGDIFEFTTKEESQHIPEFFKTLAQSQYKGMRPEFWHDFIRGTLPKELNDIYLKAGGDSAVEKADLALSVVADALAKPRANKKEVDLLVSHEEVIGSLAYQVLEYVRDNNLADEAAIAQMDANKFSYNQGFDIHVNNQGKATIEVAGVTLKDIDFEDMRNYVHQKITPQAAE